MGRLSQGSSIGRHSHSCGQYGSVTLRVWGPRWTQSGRTPLCDQISPGQAKTRPHQETTKKMSATRSIALPPHPARVGENKIGSTVSLALFLENSFGRHWGAGEKITGGKRRLGKAGRRTLLGGEGLVHGLLLCHLFLRPGRAPPSQSWVPILAASGGTFRITLYEVGTQFG